MSSDTWNQLQAHKRKQESLKERLLKRRKERQGLLEGEVASVLGSEATSSLKSDEDPSKTSTEKDVKQRVPSEEKVKVTEIDASLERNVVDLLCNTLLNLPVSIDDIKDALNKNQKHSSSDVEIKTILEKLEAQALISVKKTVSAFLVIDCEYSKLEAVFEEKKGEDGKTKENFPDAKKTRKERQVAPQDESSTKSPTAMSSKRATSERRPDKSTSNKNAIESLLAMPTMKEKENNKVGEEIIELLNEPTAKELSLMEKFKSQGGTSVKEFCPYGTRDECRRNNTEKERCTKLHFKKILQKHTDESLGDCSFLNTCFHMDTCKYVHYEVDYSACPDAGKQKNTQHSNQSINHRQIAIERQKHILYPPQWVQCDMRYLDLEVLGKFSVVMADPPWDIHMEDNEMRNLRVGNLQDEGFIFLWVTGRAMELGRECLLVWGYERVDEIIWVKTNQLQRLIRTGRTGHWINHGKEHCLVGRKGDPKNINVGLDCDVLVSEVRDTSHKPDEIYGLIERLSPGTRKIELFGRQHNVQPNWITLGNQLRGVNLVDPDVVKRFKEKYPDGNCLKPAAAAPPQQIQ
eukprot:gene1119-15459_t